MHGLIDGDIIPYEFGNMTDEWGGILPAEVCIRMADERIESIIKRSGVDTYQIFLTGDGNFRHQVATILPYKGHRPKEKPRWHKVIRHHLLQTWKAELVEGMEADDAMSIAQYKRINMYRRMMHGHCTEEKLEEKLDTVICSRDKDLHMVPGWHYGWEAGKQKEKAPWFQDEVSGLRWFYTQLLTGDKVDNILGLYRVGIKAAAVKELSDIDNETDMYCHVFKHYQDRFGSYALKFLTENARLLWMLRHKEDIWEPPVTITELRNMRGDWVLDQV